MNYNWRQLSQEIGSLKWTKSSRTIVFSNCAQQPSVVMMMVVVVMRVVVVMVAVPAIEIDLAIEPNPVI